METNLQQLIRSCDQIIDDRQYNLPYRRKIHNAWDELRSWMAKNSITEFNEEIGNAFCDDMLGGHLLNSEWSKAQKVTLRAVRMLISLQSTGTLEFRGPRKEYVFYGDIGSLALEFLEYQGNELSRHRKTIENKRFYLEKLCVHLNTHNIDFDSITFQTILTMFESERFTEASRHNDCLCYREFLRYAFDKGHSLADMSVYVPDVKFVKNKEIPTTCYEGGPCQAKMYFF